jgi:hypothetical protein
MRPSRMETECRARNAAVAASALVGDLDAVHRCLQGPDLGSPVNSSVCSVWCGGMGLRGATSGSLCHARSRKRRAVTRALCPSRLPRRMGSVGIVVHTLPFRSIT